MRKERAQWIATGVSGDLRYGPFIYVKEGRLLKEFKQNFGSLSVLDVLTISLEESTDNRCGMMEAVVAICEGW